MLRFYAGQPDGAFRARRLLPPLQLSNALFDFGQPGRVLDELADLLQQFAFVGVAIGSSERPSRAAEKRGTFDAYPVGSNVSNLAGPQCDFHLLAGGERVSRVSREQSVDRVLSGRQVVGKKDSAFVDMDALP